MPKPERDRISNLWGEIADLEAINNRRAFCYEATSLAVNLAFYKYIPSFGNILELGAGLGALREMVDPIYHPRFIHTERATSYVKAFQERAEGATIKTADIYNLPFPDQSFGSVVSLAAFDTLADLETAFAQVTRVLKSGGRFMHLLDIRPNNDISALEYFAQGFVPFPGLESEDSAFQLVRREDYKKTVREVLKDKRYSIDPRILTILNAYSRNPEKTNEVLCNTPGLAQSAAIAVDALPFPKVKTPPSYEIFAERMMDDAESGELSVDIIEHLTAESITTRTDRHDIKLMDRFNYFSNHIGKISIGNTDLSPEMVFERSTIQVFVATKA